MKAEEQLIAEYVLDTTQGFPVSQRARYLHALAVLTSDDEVAAQLEQLAQDLAHADLQQGRLVLAIRQTAQGLR